MHTYNGLYSLLLIMLSVFLPSDGTGSPSNVFEDVRVINGVAMPRDFPEFEVRQVGETAPGRIFTGFGEYLAILNNDGSPYFYRHFKDGRHDFQWQATGGFSFVRGGCWDSRFFLLDGQFEISGPWALGGNVMTGGHEMICLPDGHRIFIELNSESTDLSEVIEGGDPSAVLITENVVELDENGRRVFTWIGPDHYDIHDMGEEIDPTQMIVELGHINSMSIDYDEHLVISNRHFCEITKINRKTGEVMWRLGGKKNSFAWIDEQTPFAYQHCIRPVPESPDHYILFDNGNGRKVAYSRAVEYKLDLSAMTAEKVWEYRKSPDLYFRAQGSVQRLPNGNTLIGWGLSFANEENVLLTEVSPEGDVVYEITGQEASRCHRYDWHGRAVRPYLIAEPDRDHVTLIFNQFGATGIDHYRIYGRTEGNPFVLLKTATQPYARLLPADLNENSAWWYFQVTSVDRAGRESAPSNRAYTLIQFMEDNDNLVYNGDFSKALSGWELITSEDAVASASTDEEQVHIHIGNGGAFLEHVRFSQSGLRLVQGNTYSLSFSAYADARRTIETRIDDYFTETQRLTSDPQTFSYPFKVQDPSDFDCTVSFLCGLTPGDVYLDNVTLKILSPSAVGDFVYNPPQSFRLLGNYPNPFNPSTAIRYQLPSVSKVRLEVFGIGGQLISVLVDREQSAGEHQIQLDGSGLASGVYTARLWAKGNGRAVQSRIKMVLLK